jgi:hypothetical protein
MEEQNQDNNVLDYIVKNNEDVIEMLNYLIMRVNRIEDRLNIGNEG